MLNHTSKTESNAYKARKGKIMLGLKRDKVTLVEHQSEWGEIATTTIKKLKEIFGDVAVDIQHIGSTAIQNIKAKPMLDIVVGVKSFDGIDDIFNKLEENGFYKSSSQPLPGIVLCAVKNSCESDIVLCNIHIVIIGSEQFNNHIIFRDYMNTFPKKASLYEKLKMELAAKHPDDREAYSNGKNEFINICISEARTYTELKQRFDIIKLETINKGWSFDKKYCLTKADGTRYLLRESPIEQYESKKAEFGMMKQVASLGVPMCQPIKFGTHDANSKATVYSLQSWIDGEDAENVIPLMTNDNQYAYGLEAGRILRKIHSIPAPSTQEYWGKRFNRKIDNKIKSYTNCLIKYENGQAFIDYINASRAFLENRPQCYQHGDYHIGNMMIDREGKLTIIDFNRNDFGDPWEEFNRIVWCAQKSPLFASGMVNGYFDNDVPMDFWRLLALYISSNTLSSLSWAIPFGQSEVDTMLKQAKEVLTWYDNMRNPVPTWYTEYSQNMCFCGHDCSRCITYLSTVRNDDNLRIQSQQFYKDVLKLDIPLEDVYCLGGHSNEIFKLCRECPWINCCKERNIAACCECSEYPCKPLAEYQVKYVNKCNQIVG